MAVNFAALLQDLGNCFSIFAAADPSKTNAAVVKVLPTVVATATAAEGTTNTQQLVQVGLAALRPQRRRRTNRRGSEHRAEIEEGLPVVIDLIGNLVEAFKSPPASTEVTTPTPAATAFPAEAATMAASSAAAGAARATLEYRHRRRSSPTPRPWPAHRLAETVMARIDDNGLAIIALMVIVGLVVIFHVDGTAGNMHLFSVREPGNAIDEQDHQQAQ